MSGIAMYLRLSIADGDLGKDKKEESNSIENQRLLIRTFLKDRDDIEGEIVEYIDDGYSGTNFDRPAFRNCTLTTVPISTHCTLTISRRRTYMFTRSTRHFWMCRNFRSTAPTRRALQSS